MDARLDQYLAELGASPDSLNGWTIHTAQRAGIDVAFVIARGPEMHFVSIAEGRAMSRKNILDVIAPALAEYGYITTRVPIAETDHKLREALGFTRSWDDEHYSYWALTELPYQKSKGLSCQSPL